MSLSFCYEPSTKVDAVHVCVTFVVLSVLYSFALS